MIEGIVLGWIVCKSLDLMMDEVKTTLAKTRLEEFEDFSDEVLEKLSIKHIEFKNKEFFKALSKREFALDDIEKIEENFKSIFSDDEKGKEVFNDFRETVKEILNKYPRIKEEIYTGLLFKIEGEIEKLLISSDQILTLKDFIKISNHKKMTSFLETEIVGRDKEIDDAVKLVSDNKCVIFYGKAGNGKTRFALEICREYKNINPEIEVLCLKNNNLEFYSELKRTLRTEKNYLLLIDDANHIKQIDNILECLKLKKISSKILLTCRGYAKENVFSKIGNYLDYKKYEVKKISDEDIKKICETNFGIKNPVYLKEIVRISKGNPRLAIMASKVAREENSLENIRNSTQLLNGYYKSIDEELEITKNFNLLKVAGMIAFYNKVNFQNEKIRESFLKKLEISNLTLESNLSKLDELELIDLYEDKSAKLSEQILSTYILYRAFVDKKVLCLEKFINENFEKNPERCAEVISEILEYYSSEETYDFIKSVISKIWNLLEEENSNFLGKFVVKFSYFEPIKVLILLKKEIDNLDKKKGSLLIENFGDILNSLINHKGLDNFKMGLELLFDYNNKCNEVEEVYKILTERFGLRVESYRQKYAIQNLIVSILKEKIRMDKNNTDIILFFKLSKYYLGFNFEYFESQSKRSGQFIKLTVNWSKELSDFRKLIRKEIKSLLENDLEIEECKKVIAKYSSRLNLQYDKKIFNEDIKELKEIITQYFECENLNDCITVYEIFKKYDGEKTEVVSFLENRKLEIYLSLNTFVRSFSEKEREIKMGDFYNKYVNGEFILFFKELKEILSSKAERSYNFDENLKKLFRIIVVNEGSCDVIKSNLKHGNIFRIHPEKYMDLLLVNLGKNKTFDLISKYDYEHKNTWLWSYFKCLNSSEIDDKELEKLYYFFKNYKQAKSSHYTDITFLKNFLEKDENLFVNITKILLEKINRGDIISLDLFYFRFLSGNIDNFEYFKNEASLLKKLYFELIDGDSEYHELKKYLLKKDQGFFDVLLVKIFKENKKVSLEVIWDFEKVYDYFSRMIKLCNSLEGRYYIYRDIFKSLFDDDKNQYVQDKTIEKFIGENYKNSEVMELLFEVTSYFSSIRRIRFISKFLKLNKDIDAFKKINLLPMSRCWGGSQVPIILQDIEFHEKLKKEIDGIDYLEHLDYLDGQVENLKNFEKKVKIKEFMEE